MSRARRAVLALVALTSCAAMVAPSVDADPPPVRPALPFSAIGSVLPSEPIAPAQRIRPLPRSAERIPATVPWKNGRRFSVERFLRATHTRAFVVVHRGRVVHEWYDDVTTQRTKLASWSVAKSLVAMLAAQAIDEKKLRLGTRVVDVLPYLRVDDAREGDRAYNRITVRDLLDMTSGIDAPESYESDPLADPTSIADLLNGTYVPRAVAAGSTAT